MRTTIFNHSWIWAISILVFILGFWLLGGVFLPFILGIAIAYLLDPLVDRIEKLGFGRIAAVLIISIGAILVALPALLILITAVVNQIKAMSAISFSITEILEFESFLKTILPKTLSEQLDLVVFLDMVEDFIKPRSEEIVAILGPNILESILKSAISLTNVAATIIILPVVTVYLLLDWDRLIKNIDSLLPRDHVVEIRLLAKEIDGTISKFIRGMGSVCLILAIFYAFALWYIGLKFGLAVGFFAGLATFVPYLGPLLGGFLAICLGLFEFWDDWAKISVIVGVFIFGQVFEGNYLTPKLVGKNIGLHPVWLLLALYAFGNMLGFVGLLIAIPLAASIGVIVRHLIGKYKSGSFYTGQNQQ